MKVHQIKINFNVTTEIARYVYVYLIEAQNIYMIDSGVAGSERQIEEYLTSIGRETSDIKAIFLTHAHPDHIGTAAYFKQKTGCRVYASEGERAWIEDIDVQYKKRPIPNFYALAGKSVNIDVVVHDKEVFLLEGGIKIEAVSTPGHSADGMSYVVGSNAFIGDTIPVKGDIPIYISKEDSINSIYKIMALQGMENYYPAWDCTYTKSEIKMKCRQALDLIEQLDDAVKSIKEYKSIEELTHKIFEQMGNTSPLNNPLFMRTIKSHLQCKLRPFVYEDAATILSWCKDKRAFRLWSADRYKDYPATPDEMLRQYEGESMFPLTMVEGGKVVGHILLRYPTNDTSVVRFGFVIVDDVLRGMSYGKKLLQLAIEYAQSKLGAKKITLGVFYDNPSALECYKSIGFNIADDKTYEVDGEKWIGAEMDLICNILKQK